MTNIGRRGAPKEPLTPRSTPGLKSLVHVEPYRLWTIKFLKKFNIVSKEELSRLLEKYLDSVNKIKANISKDTEKESDEYLITLEPTKWKEQDHYLVLGLQHLRWKCTDEDIRRAHRRKALKHHPDKRGKSSVDLESDYYSCITRAMDILADPIKRKSFDSVDPTFDDTIPTSIKSTRLENNSNLFYKTFGPVFELNARWSVKSSVPYLGNDLSTRDDVETFYEFWYNFQSWREFSYLDEEDKDKGENRDERRWLDRQNKAARQQRKKSENQRIRQLVDNAYSCDPRIAKFKEEDKRRKLDVKRARQEEIRQRIEREEAEKARQIEDERRKKLAAEDEEKRKKLEEKKARDQVKKEMKRVVKGLEDLFRANEYFSQTPKEKIRHIEELDKLVKILDISDVRLLKKDMEDSTDYEVRKSLFLKRVNKINGIIEEEKKQSLNTTSSSASAHTNGSANKTPGWTEEEIKLLVKAVSLFPAGTKDRWDVIANYMGEHSANSVHRDAKQVLTKVKQIQEQLVKRRS